MGFDIPMNSKGCMTADSLLSLNNGCQGMSSPQPMPQQSYQQPMQQNYQQAQPQMQAQPMQQNYQQQQTYQQPQMQTQPMQQQTYQQSAPAPRQRPQGGGVILKKGQKVNLADNGQTLTRIKACLGWDVTNGACDLDVSAFLLGANGKVLGDDWFVFYGQTISPDGSIQHSGDSAGECIGDDEVITINLAAVNANIKKIVFVITINEALERGLNFSMVQNAYVRVVDDTTGRELIRFTLTDYYANVTSMMVGEVYNHNGQWKFNAIGDGVAKDLAGLCEMYGVNVAG